MVDVDSLGCLHRFFPSQFTEAVIGDDLDVMNGDVRILLKEWTSLVGPDKASKKQQV